MNSSYNHDEMLTTVFPSVGMRVLSNVINIIGVSACAFCFARRSASVNLFSWRTLTSMSWARLCVYLLFLDSWIFIVTSGILINGVGMSRSTLICSLGIYACIFAYASTKFLIYMFLTEKVHVVWGKGKNVPRLASPVYRICAVVLLIYVAVFVIIIVGKVAFLRDDQTCVIGLKTWASIPLLTYDLVVNILLTGLFLWPMLTSDNRSARIRRVTVRTLIAALASLATSTVNILILTLMHGHQLGWVCLGSCGTDVILNAVVVYWVTEAPARSSDKEAKIELTNNPNTPNTHKFVISTGSVTSPTRASRLGARVERGWESEDEFADPRGGISTDTGSRSLTGNPQGAAFSLSPVQKPRSSVVGNSGGPGASRTVTFNAPTASLGARASVHNPNVSVTATAGRQGFMGTMLNGLGKKRDRDRERAVDHTASLSEPQSPICITVTKEVMDEDQVSRKSSGDLDHKA